MVTKSDPNITGSIPSEGFPEGSPFPPGFPFPFPPSTGPTMPWPDDPKNRQGAIDFGQKHADAIAAVERLADQYGGGLMGAAKGFLNEYERRQIITPRDKERLIAILSALRDMDQVTGSRRIQELHDEAVGDPTSKPAALAVSSVAANIAAEAMTDTEAQANAWAAGYADGVTVVLTLGFGPLVALGAGYGASYVARHTHVSWH